MARKSKPMRPLFAGQEFAAKPHWKGKVIFQKKDGKAYMISHQYEGKGGSLITDDFHIHQPTRKLDTKGWKLHVKITPAGLQKKGYVPIEITEAVGQLMPEHMSVKTTHDNTAGDGQREATVIFRKA